MRHNLDPTKAALMQPGYGNKPCAAPWLFSLFFAAK
jgi:hypothetical protein